jgi:hypothetical protein
MTARLAAAGIGLLLGAVVLFPPAAGAIGQVQGTAKTAPAPVPPAPAAPAPWPTAAELGNRRREAERRRLFASDEPQAVRLIADFKQVNRDRDPLSTKMYPATIEFTEPDGTARSMPLQIRTRGHSRRRPTVCDFAPLRLEFQKELTKGTLFDGPRALKLGTHCRHNSTFENYVLREYAVYRLLNLLTPRSFRARLAKATYIDAASKRPVGTRYGIFIEDDDDVARRLEGRITDVKNMLFYRLHGETLTLMALFEFMIGNTDMSILHQHNVRLVETPAKEIYPVPYDFDFSGLVNTTYAAADKRLGITSVRDRLYRGPCRTPQELEPAFAKFKALKTDLLAVYDQIPDMSGTDRREARTYLEEFFRLIDRPRDVRTAILDPCLQAGM